MSAHSGPHLIVIRLGYTFSRSAEHAVSLEPDSAQHAPLTGAGRGNTQAASAIQWVSSEAMDDMPSGIRMRSADAHTFKPDIHLETHFTPPKRIRLSGNFFLNIESDA
ncbi:hypothetical protein VDG44_09060 [Xanthomonas campestris pv. raphani]|uniref:hypothetical protein n=1 Tax=Xanthomonas campestris TaxID=339 RepID=UPI002B23E85E|nr:hypothetical protein [Xanthomonas campestris]MEA9904705.1 hypothetical protein [Xanthomonas campestris pv. raphani]